MKIIRYSYCERKAPKKAQGNFGTTLERPSFLPLDMEAAYVLVCSVCDRDSEDHTKTQEKYNNRTTSCSFGYAPNTNYNSWVRVGKKYFYICEKCEDIYKATMLINHIL